MLNYTCHGAESDVQCLQQQDKVPPLRSHGASLETVMRTRPGSAVCTAMVPLRPLSSDFFSFYLLSFFHLFTTDTYLYLCVSTAVISKRH